MTHRAFRKIDARLDPLSTMASRQGTDQFGFHEHAPNYRRLFAPFRRSATRHAAGPGGGGALAATARGARRAVTHLPSSRGRSRTAPGALLRGGTTLSGGRNAPSDDPYLAQRLVGALLAQDRASKARQAFGAALADGPRSAALHMLITQVRARLGEPGIEPATRAGSILPRHRGAPGLIGYGKVQARAGRRGEVEAALAEAAALPGQHAARVSRSLRAVHAALGEAARAQEATHREGFPGLDDHAQRRLRPRATAR